MQYLTTVNISNSSLHRARCKHCKSPPMVFYFQGIKYIFTNHEEFSKFNSLINFIPVKSSLRFLKESEPSKCINLQRLNYNKHYHNFNIRNFFKLYNMNVIEKLSCKCGKTRFAGTSENLGNKFYLGVGTRLGRYNYSSKLIS